MKSRGIPRTCKECHKSFYAQSKEINRGNALFCSLSCNAYHQNKVRSAILIEHGCRYCGRTYSNNSKISFYCSRNCKARFYYYRTKKNSSSNHTSLIYKLRKKPCEICGWDEATRDVHHIISVSKGGKDTNSNLIAVCPNHHRMIHRNLISQNDLKKIAKSRTISSSNKK